MFKLIYTIYYNRYNLCCRTHIDRDNSDTTKTNTTDSDTTKTNTTDSDTTKTNTTDSDTMETQKQNSNTLSVVNIFVMGVNLVATLWSALQRR